MKYRQLGLFVIAYFVITMAWAYPWHMMWFHDAYVEMGAFQRAEPIMVLGMAAIVLQGWVIGYLYPFYADRKGYGIWSGIRFNLIVGLMTYTVMGFVTAAKFQIEPVSTFLAYHTVFQALQFIFTGTALGLIYRKEK